MARPFAPRIVSANSLLDGDVVYLGRAGEWTRRLCEGAIAASEDEAAALLAQAGQPSQVVGPYLIEVDIGADGCPAPRDLRERFRDRGPTNRPDHGRQAERSPAPATPHTTLAGA